MCGSACNANLVVLTPVALSPEWDVSHPKSLYIARRHRDPRGVLPLGVPWSNPFRVRAYPDVETRLSKYRAQLCQYEGVPVVPSNGLEANPPLRAPTRSATPMCLSRRSSAASRAKVLRVTSSPRSECCGTPSEHVMQTGTWLASLRASGCFSSASSCASLVFQTLTKSPTRSRVASTSSGHCLPLALSHQSRGQRPVQLKLFGAELRRYSGLSSTPCVQAA